MLYLRLFVLYFKLGILGELEYRANFWVQIFESIMSLTVAIGALLVVFEHTEQFGGWLQDQLLALMGIHLTIGGILALVISPSLERFVQDVRKGMLDFTLTKPADAQFMVSFQRVQVWKLIDVLFGLAVVVIAIIRLSGTIGWGEALGFLVALAAGTLIVYSFWVILATTSFWIIRAENIFQVFNALFVAGRWPVSIYPQWLRMVLTFIVPIAFAVTVPAEGLIGILTPQTLMTAIGLSLVLAIIARGFWRFGLKFYSGASA